MSTTKHHGATLPARGQFQRAAIALLILCAAPRCTSQPPALLAHPTTGPCFLLIEEHSRRSPSIARILDDQSIAVWMRSHGARWLWVSPETEDETGGFPEWLQEYLDTAEAAGLPYLFVTDELGDVLWEGKPPDTPAAFLKRLEELEETRRTSTIAPGRSPGQEQLDDPTRKRPRKPTAEQFKPLPTQP